MTTALLADTLQLIENAPISGQDADAKVRHLLRAEYMRKLGQYRRVDQALSQKYGIAFDVFLQDKIVEKEGFTWEVEIDAIDWETAISGMRTIERKLIELG